MRKAVALALALAWTLAAATPANAATWLIESSAMPGTITVGNATVDSPSATWRQDGDLTGLVSPIQITITANVAVWVQCRVFNTTNGSVGYTQQIDAPQTGTSVTSFFSNFVQTSWNAWPYYKCDVHRTVNGVTHLGAIWLHYGVNDQRWEKLNG